MRFLNNLKKNSLFNVAAAFGLKVFGTAFSVITSIMLGRTFSTEGTGVYSLASSILTVIMIFTVFGFDISLVKYVSIEFKRNTHGNLKKIIKNTMSISLLLCLCFVIIVELTGDVFAFVFSDPKLSVMLRIMIVAIIPMTLLKLLVSFLKGIGYVKVGLSFESVVMHIFLCICLVFILIITREPGIEMVGIAYLISATMSFLIVFFISRSHYIKFNNETTDDFSFTPVINTARTLLLVNSTNYILTSMDSMMLGALTSTSDVGIYTVATKITLLSSMLLSAINAILGPRFAVLFKENKINELKTVVRKFSRAMLGVAIGICIVISVCAKWILMLWGKEFTEGICVLQISLIGQFVVLATGPLATLLMMCGYEKIHRNNTVFCAIINLVLNAVLIPIFGINGAAVATAVSLIVKNVYCVFVVKQKLGFWCY